MKKFLLFLLGLFSFSTGVAPTTAAVASAAETPEIEYTSVLEDLQKDTLFDAIMYPYVEDDHSLQVIQIAESVNKELFVYVYQPSAPKRVLEATTIRMSTQSPDEKNQTWHDYDLTLLSSASVFHKYRVEDFTVKESTTRYYDITAIHRLWIEGIDAPSDKETDQEINEVVFKVGKTYKSVDGNGGEVTYYHDSDVVTVTAKVVGYIYYKDPSFWSFAACDRHIVAFSVDRKIDKLYEVDLEYISQLCADGIYNNEIVADGWVGIGEKEEKRTTLHADKDIIYDKDGIFVDTRFYFEEITTTEEFISSTKDVNFTKGALSDLKTTDFVLTYDVTDVESYGSIWTSSSHFGKYRTQNSNVTIIRLKFEVNGKMFNLGVVDNKQTGTQLGSKGCRRIDWRVLVIIAAIVLLVIWFLKYEGFRKFVFVILKAVGVVVAWPVLLPILIVQKVKGG